MTRSVSQGDSSTRLPQGCRVACCRSSYHEEITRAMRDSAHDVLLEAGLAQGDFLETEVPGAFELPLGSRTRT